MSEEEAHFNYRVRWKKSTKTLENVNFSPLKEWKNGFQQLIGQNSCFDKENIGE